MTFGAPGGSSLLLCPLPTGLGSQANGFPVLGLSSGSCKMGRWGPLSETSGHEDNCEFSWQACTAVGTRKLPPSPQSLLQAVEAPLSPENRSGLIFGVW